MVGSNKQRTVRFRRPLFVYSVKPKIRTLSYCDWYYFCSYAATDLLFWEQVMYMYVILGPNQSSEFPNRFSFQYILLLLALRNTHLK